MPTVDEKRELFFKMLLGKNTGYLCLARSSTTEWEEEFFRYPEELPKAIEYANRYYQYNLYFCPQLLKAKRRVKQNVSVAPVMWSDLDDCSPDELKVQPSIVIESSPNRYQAYWLLENELMDPFDVEDLCRRFAYFYKDKGVDSSGWDLTQLLRIPYSSNFKYKKIDVMAVPEVKVLKVSKDLFKIEDFDYLPKFQDYIYADVPMPDLNNLQDGRKLLEERNRTLNPKIWEMMTKEHEEHTWSTALWNLEMLLFENGFDRVEVFSIVQNASCNKYERDGRPAFALWKEVLRCEAKYISQESLITGKYEPLTPLLTDEELETIKNLPKTFVEEYITWASTLGDAAPQYHQAGAFVILSTLMCGSLYLPTSFGKVFTNLWFMILADTTLTRKSTAMDIAMDLLEEVNDDVIAATDGSLEGLLGSLSLRPGRPSIFLKDEFSGLVDSIAKKDYMAGMAEMLTKLYDGKLQKRILKREVVEVKDPRLIIFGGGIKDKVTGSLTLEHIGSGFIPRFVFITAESDVTRIKPIGPPSSRNNLQRTILIKKLEEIRKHYNPVKPLMISKNDIQAAPNDIEATLTDDAWIRYNKFETDMVELGVKHNVPEAMTPMYDRLAKSVLKCAVLIAGSRNTETSEVVVELSDMLRAIGYGTHWKTFADDIVSNVGKSDFEKITDRVYKHINARKAGVPKSTVMRYYRLSARDMSAVLDTLEQRALISRVRKGKTELLIPLE